MSADYEIINALMAKLYRALAAGNPLGGLTADGSYYVSFCNDGIPVADRDLDFGPTMTNAAQVEAASAFGEITAIIPPVGGFWRDTGTRLWDVYQHVLDDAVLPLTALNAGEQALLDQRINFLWVKGAQVVGGVTTETVTESAVYKNYQAKRAEYQTALVNYNNYLLQVISKPDDPQLAAWWQIAEPQYQSLVTDAMNAWVASGKYTVEDAIATIERLTHKSPASLWASYRQQLGQFKRTDIQNIDYYYSEPLTHNFDSNDGLWTVLTFTSDEAPAVDLSSKSLWGGGAPLSYSVWKEGATASQPSTDIFSLNGQNRFTMSLEYRRVPIRRPWFHAEVFKNRNWRFANSSEFLCDGQLPPVGDCAAYPVEIIIARNLRISFTNTSLKSQDTNSQSLGFGLFRLRGKTLTEEWHPQAVDHIRTLTNKPWVDPLPPSVVKQPLRLDTLGSVGQATIFPAGVPALPNSHVGIGSIGHNIHNIDMVGNVPSSLLSSTNFSNRDDSPFTPDLHILATSVNHNPSVLPNNFLPPMVTIDDPPHLLVDSEIIPQISPQSGRLPQDVSQSGNVLNCPGMQIIGFGCQLLAKCPNPDDSLQWP